MDDSDDIICLDSPPKPARSEVTRDAHIPGIPSSFAGDKLKRFSFGCSSTPPVKRRSISQPIRPCSTSPVKQNSDDAAEFKEDDEEIPMSTQAAALVSPRKKAKAPKERSVLAEFFGVYCLISRSTHKSYKNRCYVGFTVDPNRRINQHNGGREKGGAKKTDSRGPWDMVCIIHGFPNSVAALRFEWAWQNPEKSKAIKQLNLKKTRKETPFAFRLRIACHLLNCSPWKRFALTFRWLLPTEELPFPSDIRPPIHIDKAYGLVTKSTVPVANESSKYAEPGNCQICTKKIAKLSGLVRCLKDGCESQFHIGCFATYGQGADNKNQLFPLRVSCPKCYSSFLWGDVVREQHNFLKVVEANEESVLLRDRLPKGLSLTND